SLDKLRLEFGSRVRIMNLDSLMDDLLINRYDVWVVAISTRQPIIRVGNNVRNIPDLVIDVSVPAAVYVDGVPVKVLRLGDLREPYLKYVNGKVNTTDYLREVEAEAERIMRLIARSDADEVVRGIMRFVEEILNNEIREAINALNNGADPREVVEAMGRSLVKKLMHNYLENVRALAETGDISGAERLRDLFTRIIKSPGT
ncbi:MAG: glutamyl-tRNA reductase, partial [Vulcanisaeta sp.]|nr:glutamyl-tRNA reductase [Vulcanisaeta sp.]